MNSLISTLKTFTIRFYLYNLIQGIERTSIWILIIQLPIYIAQADAKGGLHWSHTEKGVLFAIWALSQNLTTIFSGYYADRFGRNIVIGITALLCGVFIFSMNYSNSFLLFAIMLAATGISSGFFKPALQGAIASEMNEENSALGWSFYTWGINAFIFAIGTPLAIYLSNISFWYVFTGAALVQLLIPLTILLFVKNTPTISNKRKFLFRDLLSAFSNKQLNLFTLSIVGFTITYMQFYENLPNYIFDWMNTSDLVTYFGLSGDMVVATTIGKVVAYPWFYNLNTGLVLLLCIPFAFFSRKLNRLKLLLISICLAIAGLLFSGLSVNGLYLAVGIIIYTLGEMIANPNINRYIANLAPTENKSQYMGFTSIAWSLGLGFGAIFGGMIYDKFADKSQLALQYCNMILNKFPAKNDALNLIMTTKHLNGADATLLLYYEFSPQVIWYIIAAIGLISTLQLIFFLQKYK